MKSLYIIIPIVFLVVILGLLFSVTAMEIYDIPETKEKANITHEGNDKIMFREELWYYPVKAISVNISYENVSLGIAGQTDEIHFGRIPIGSSSRKGLDISSNKKARTTFHLGGNITPYVELPEKILVDEDKRKIEVKFYGEDSGNFTGTLMIRNIIPKNFFAESIMGAMP